MSNYYPPSGYAFRLQMISLSSLLDNAGFQEVTGLGMEMQTEEYHEGGCNTYTHCLPSGVKSGRLVLKRGLMTEEQPLYLWCEQTLQDGLSSPVSLANFNLQLLANNSTDPTEAPLLGDVLMSWILCRVWPVKWEISGLHSMESQVVIESMELSYSFCLRLPGFSSLSSVLAQAAALLI